MCCYLRNAQRKPSDSGTWLTWGPPSFGVSQTRLHPFTPPAAGHGWRAWLFVQLTASRHAAVAAHTSTAVISCSKTRTLFSVSEAIFRNIWSLNWFCKACVMKCCYYLFSGEDYPAGRASFANGWGGQIRWVQQSVNHIVRMIMNAHKSTQQTTTRVGALVAHHPAWVSHHTGWSRSTPTVHPCSRKVEGCG